MMEKGKNPNPNREGGAPLGSQAARNCCRVKLQEACPPNNSPTHEELNFAQEEVTL